MRLDVEQLHAFALKKSLERADLIDDAVSSSGRIFISRRPKPCRSGSEGWAPTLTLCRFASRTVRAITVGSEAWKPQATLAMVINGIKPSSSPIL
jgi:hypothetical protein